ncbi:hypothetical protein SCUCBS95973_001052 [Sporothrix curviconia]|uniref:SET domain-containing protein n=1 Tax=Sporothrix curviconia TaxID=1260050 RepID=A0ABP0AVN8_9PEZI
MATNNDSRGRGGNGRGQSLVKAVPPNWPSSVRYLAIPVYAGISPRQRELLQTQLADMPGASASTPPLPEIPSILRFGPSPLVEIRCIADPAHPACGQHGLFAARHLPAGSFILPYLGVYHRGNVTVGRRGQGTNLHNKKESDYDLWLDRDADVAVDADRCGNEARFINDYRGTGKPRANAEFREVWDPRRGERGMAVYVLPVGKRLLQRAAAGAPSSSGSNVGGIAKGEEILVSYGKGFWEMRQKEEQAKRASGESASTTADGTGDQIKSPVADAATAVPSASKDKGREETTDEPADESSTTALTQQSQTHSGIPEADSVTDRMGSLKVVAKFPKNLSFQDQPETADRPTASTATAREQSNIQSGRPEIESVTDQMGSLKVVAKFPKNLSFQ